MPKRGPPSKYLQLAQRLKRRTPYSRLNVVRTPTYNNRPERKVINSTGTAENYEGNTGTLVLLNSVDQGVTPFTRVGSKIILKSISVKLLHNSDPLALDATQKYARYLVVYDRSPNGFAFTPSEVLDDCTHVYDHKSWNYASRFQILKDDTVTLDIAPLSDHVYNQSKYYQFYKRINLPVMFNGSGNGVTDIKTGSLYLVIITTSGTVTYKDQIEYDSQVTFIDP